MLGLPSLNMNPSLGAARGPQAQAGLESGSSTLRFVQIQLTFCRILFFFCKFAGKWKAETPCLFALTLGLPALCHHACVQASSHLSTVSCSFLFPAKASGDVCGLRLPLRCSLDPGEARDAILGKLHPAATRPSFSIWFCGRSDWQVGCLLWPPDVRTL